MFKWQQENVCYHTKIVRAGSIWKNRDAATHKHSHKQYRYSKHSEHALPAKDAGQTTSDPRLVALLERMLADDGAVILKFWFHLSKKAQRKRLKELKKDKLTSWRVTAKDEAFFTLSKPAPAPKPAASAKPISLKEPRP